MPAVLYAGTWGGGVFKSLDGGANWSPFNPGLTSNRVNVLTISPRWPTQIYAGTFGSSAFALQETEYRTYLPLALRR